MKETIVTQQDQSPFGQVVARHGTTPGCSGCDGLGPHTEACRVRLEKAFEAPIGPITGSATESQEPTPAAQQEPESSSSRPAAPIQQKIFRTNRLIHRWSWDHKERRERKRARPTETPTSEISGKPVVKARSASSQ